MTTAFLTLRLALGDFAHREVPFDHILDEVSSGRADVGPRDPRGPAHLRGGGPAQGARPGEWWLLETGLPLPLGVNVARRDLGDRLPDLSAVLDWTSIQAGLANRREAMRYAMRFGRGIDVKTADRFVEMYVNELTCDYGDEGRRAVAELLSRGDAIGAFPEPVRLDYVPEMALELRESCERCGCAAAARRRGVHLQLRVHVLPVVFDRARRRLSELRR